MIVRGDKIELVKETRAFKKIGTQFEVDRIDADGNITFNFYGCDCEAGLPGRATMTYKEFEKYFKIVPEKVQRVWSEWVTTEVKYYSFLDRAFCSIVAKYRANGKKVQIRPLRGYAPSINSLRAEAACAPSDTFDLKKGLRIAETRLVKKLSDRSYEKYEERWRN